MPGVFCAAIAHAGTGKVPAYDLAFADLATFNATYTTYQDQLLRLISSSSKIVLLGDPPGSLTATSAQNYYAPPNSFLFGKDAAIDHWHNGLPYTSDGAIAVESAGVSFYHNGVPFTAAGKVAIDLAAPVFEDPNHNAGTVLWLDASDDTTYDNQDGYITYWNDKSSSGYNFSGTGPLAGPSPAGGGIVSAIQNGLNGLWFYSTFGYPMTSDDAASTWAFLNDGTQFQIYMVVRTYTGQAGTMLGTGVAATPVLNGFLLDNDDVTYVDAVIHQVGNGSAAVITDNQGSKFDNTAQLLFLSSDAGNGTAASRSKIGIDGGALSGSQAATGTPSASDPVGTLIIGADATEANPGEMLLFELVIVQGAYSASDRSDMETYLTTKWGL